jgi:lipid-binding SYLF domain-containing protein
MRLIMATMVATTLALTPLLAADDESAKRLNDAAVVFSEVMESPDKGMPQDLLEKAHCIVIVPGPQNRGVRRRREVREGLPVLSKQERSGLVRARYGPHRGRERRISDRRLVHGLDHVGHE